MAKTIWVESSSTTATKEIFEEPETESTGDTEWPDSDEEKN